MGATGRSRRARAPAPCGPSGTRTARGGREAWEEGAEEKVLPPVFSLICSDRPKSGLRVWPRAPVPRAAPALVNSTQASGRPARCWRRGILQSVRTRPRVTLLPREGGGLLGVPRSRVGGRLDWSRRTPRQTHSAPLTAGRSIPRLEFQRTGRATAPPRALRRTVSAKSRAPTAGIARAWAGRQVPGLRRLPGLGAPPGTHGPVPRHSRRCVRWQHLNF